MGSKRILASNKKYKIIADSIFNRYFMGKTNPPPEEQKPLPAPYPYKEKGYGFWNALFDDTFKRMNHNSMIICIEGPPFVGKTCLGKELACEFDMQYMKSVDLDMLYINEYGYDMRQLDHLLPESCRSLSWKTFWERPQNLNTAALQIITYKLKYEQYINALIHLLNTGQGVVVDGSSVFSDFVFLEAKHEHGLVSDGARSVYCDFLRSSIHELLKPHLILYLNLTAKDIYDRIKTCGEDYQKTSPLLDTTYFNTVNCLLKQEFLTRISKHSEVLIYDWTHYGDTEIVVEDIERMNFDKYKNKVTYNPHETKLADWRQLRTDWDWNFARINFMLLSDRYKYASERHRKKWLCLYRFQTENIAHRHGKRHWEYIRNYTTAQVLPNERYNDYLNLYCVKLIGRHGK